LRAVRQINIKPKSSITPLHESIRRTRGSVSGYLTLETILTILQLVSLTPVPPARRPVPIYLPAATRNSRNPH